MIPTHLWFLASNYLDIPSSPIAVAGSNKYCSCRSTLHAERKINITLTSLGHQHIWVFLVRSCSLLGSTEVLLTSSTLTLPPKTSDKSSIPSRPKSVKSSASSLFRNVRVPFRWMVPETVESTATALCAGRIPLTKPSTVCSSPASHDSSLPLCAFADAIIYILLNHQQLIILDHSLQAAQVSNIRSNSLLQDSYSSLALALNSTYKKKPRKQQQQQLITYNQSIFHHQKLSNLTLYDEDDEQQNAELLIFF